MYERPSYGELPPVFLSSTCYLSAGRHRIATAASGTWSATNRIIYVPFALNVGVMVYRYFWLNGATVGTNNLQVGVYDAAFARINAGTSTLSAGANICQFDNITDYYLGPGRYYMAMWGNGTTATVFRNDAATGSIQGVYYETNASGLPTTGTPADPAVAVSAFIPVFGLALRATDP